MAVDCVNEDSIRNMVEARGDTSIDDIVCEIAKYNLHYFVHQGKVGQLKALLSLGAIQDVPSEDGSTAFTLALGTLNTGTHLLSAMSIIFSVYIILQSVHWLFLNQNWSPGMKSYFWPRKLLKLQTMEIKGLQQ